MKKTLTLFALLTALVPALAQEADITKYYLTNAGFDSNFDHKADETTAVAQELNAVSGWTSQLSAEYTIAGTYEWGFKGKFNTTTMPAEGYNGETDGGALAISTGWEQTFCFYQTVTLPKGDYIVRVPTYNTKSAKGGVSQLAWIPNSGTKVQSNLSSYPSKVWTVDSIVFTLNTTTTGKIQIGYKAVANGSINSANLLVDYVQLAGSNMTVNKTTLRTALTKANNLYGTGEGIGAADLKTVIDASQAVLDQSDATMPQVLEAVYQLNQAMETYNILNASEDKPVDRTSYITNPSFESNGTAGWTVSSMQTQTNSVFTKKKGNVYLEKWVSIGQQLGNAAVTQTLRNLTRGHYRLKASALHIQQSGDNSLVNKGDPQTGAFIFAGNSKVEVTAIKDYSLLFAVIDEQADVEIGMKAENATGNYLCVDNFILQYVGAVSTDVLADDVKLLTERATELKTLGVQQAVDNELATAIDAAQKALEGTGTDGGGKTVYDEAALSNARTLLLAAIEKGEASRSRYDALQERISYAETVVGWWTGVERKATSLANLTTALETARQQLTDYKLSDSDLDAAVSTLNTRIKSVDKKIYCSANACGTDADLKKATSQWCYDRSMQSKHWILFWEAGYGNDAPAVVPGILATADKIFEFYADSLKFITINQGKSKTDTYKMIIRLRHTTTWEASGSGIDNQIGLLTLSNGAHTSRSGQTVAHEIGHCFQYQTHCDNNNQNGWMYNWGQSTLNVFWEMCAQWQAYKFYPHMQFVWDSNKGNDWFGNTLNGLHRHPLCPDLRYHNFFIQDYFCHKHGIDMIARLWNESRSPEDPLQAYMRLTMTGTTAQKLSQLNDEMWEYGARMTTYDMDPIREQGASTILQRNQTELKSLGDNWYEPTKANCIENFGNNATRLNVPTTAKTVYVDIVGEAGKTGFTAYNVKKAGWRYGFAAMLKDNTRIYSEPAAITYTDSVGRLAFDCPDNCKYLWLVVSGAPEAYWTRDWISWSEESTAEQWPYRFKLYQTNIFGKANNNTLPDGIENIRLTEDWRIDDNAVYDLQGRRVDVSSALPKGIYIIRGRKVLVK